MFMILRKKTIIVVVLFVALCVAGYLSAAYSDSEAVSGDAQEVQYEPVGRSEMVSADTAQTDKYTQALEKRKTDRDMAVNLLNDTVNNVSASAQARQEASDKIAAIADHMLKESAIEDLLKAKGYEKCVVYINDKEINATVFTENLSDTDVAKIKDIIISQTDNNNIKIVAVR